MMAPQVQRPALRPFLPDDVPVLAEIYQASIEGLTGEDYSEAQQAAWASLADDVEAFGRRLAESLTLVATIGGSTVGFASLKGADHLDLLYVHPAAAGQGVGTLLAEALEKLAAARGAKRLTADVSDTARDFFEKRGFEAQRRKTVQVADEWLGNTTMDKPLAPAEARKLSS
jgi:putative acetyltransferase